MYVMFVLLDVELLHLEPKTFYFLSESSEVDTRDDANHLEIKKLQGEKSHDTSTNTIHNNGLATWQCLTMSRVLAAITKR